MALSPTLGKAKSQNSVLSGFGNTRYGAATRQFHSELPAAKYQVMNVATPFPRIPHSKTDGSAIGFLTIFEHAPFAAARCNSQGFILEINPAFRRSFDPELLEQSALRMCDLFPLSNRAAAESGLSDLFNFNLESIDLEWNSGVPSSMPSRWTGWRVPPTGNEPAQAILMDKAGRSALSPVPIEESLLQAQRWERRSDVSQAEWFTTSTIF